MGEVYKAQDTFLGRFAALKVLAEKYLQDREAPLEWRSGSRSGEYICRKMETGPPGALRPGREPSLTASGAMRYGGSHIPEDQSELAIAALIMEANRTVLRR